MSVPNPISFKKKYNLQQRIQKSKKQLTEYPNKIPIIAQKHKKSNLPTLANQKLLCDKNYKFSMLKQILQKKIKQSTKTGFSGKVSFFVYINGNIPQQEIKMEQIYEKWKDQDGFLYVQYGEQQSM